MSRTIALSLIALVALTGCGSSSGSTEVVAGFYPLQFVTQTLLDEPVTNLTKPGVEPHDLDLSVKSTAALTSAKLVVRLDGFQPAVDKVAKGADNDLDVFAAADLETRDGGIDPHFWQDPIRLAAVAKVVAARLDKVYPDRAAAIDGRLSRLVDSLEQLDTAYRQGLRNCRTRTIIVNHEAFGYLSKYGLDVVPYAGLSPDAEPSAAQIGRVERLIRKQAITTVYGEVLVSNRGLDAIAADLGLSISTLDPLEGPHARDSQGDYFALMKSNLAALQKGNQCHA